MTGLFQPLKDKNLPEDVEAYYFGGGYPELHALLWQKQFMRDCYKIGKAKRGNYYIG
jgi:cobyrinic acid a,c-diamide synthase